MSMEGLLLKWTNYWSGWQPRWFILENGILSYYNSQDEVNQGCKGSIKMSVCDVMVDHGDPTRLELSIPGEQRFYLKASNFKERQQWLVALGSCKASLQTLSNPPTPSMSSSEYSKLDSSMKQKKSELRVYCDLLMQQVHDIRTAATTEPVDGERIKECSNLLSETCDTFINTLEDCFKLIDKPIRPLSNKNDSIPAVSPSSPVNPGMKRLSPSPTQEKQPLKSILRKPPRRTISQSSTEYDTDSPSVHSLAISSMHVSSESEGPKAEANGYTEKTTDDKDIGRHEGSTKVKTSSLPDNQQTDGPPADNQQTDGPPADNRVDDNQADEDLPFESPPSQPPTLYNNFFNTRGTTFISVMEDNANHDIDTRSFLAAASQLALVFGNLDQSSILSSVTSSATSPTLVLQSDHNKTDRFNSSAFSPLKNDLLGNVKKVEQKWVTDPKGFRVLQNIIDHEMSTQRHLDPNAATQALLWLTRSLLYVSALLEELALKPTMDAVLNAAYEKTLKPYHNFVVRGVVSIAARAAPYKENFLAALMDECAPDEKPAALTALFREMDSYKTQLRLVCAPLIKFYMDRNMAVVADVSLLYGSQNIL